MKALRLAFTLSAVSMATVLGTTGCSPAGTGGTGGASASQQADGERTVTVWTINLKKNFQDYIQGMLDKYEGSHPGVTVKWVDVPGADMSNKLLASIAAGNPPDLVNITSADIDQFVPSLADMGQYLGKDQQNIYQPNLIDPLRRKGKLIGVPWYNVGPPVMLYNKTVLDKAGVNPPTTLAEVQQIGATIHQKTGTYGALIFPGSTTLRSQGVQLLNADHTAPAFDTPETAAILRKWVQAYKDGAIPPGIIAPDDRNYPQTLGSKQVAMEPQGGASELVGLEQNAPDVFPAIKVAQAATGESDKFFLPSQQTFAVPAASKHQKDAAELAGFMTNVDNQLAFCKLVAIFPSATEVLKDPLFASPDTSTTAGMARKAAVAGYDKLSDGALGTGQDRQLTDALDEQVRAMLTDKVSVQDGLTKASNQWTDMLAKGASK